MVLLTVDFQDAYGFIQNLNPEWLVVLMFNIRLVLTLHLSDNDVLVF